MRHPCVTMHAGWRLTTICFVAVMRTRLKLGKFSTYRSKTTKFGSSPSKGVHNCFVRRQPKMHRLARVLMPTDIGFFRLVRA